MLVVIMGVSGSGKSIVGKTLASKLKLPFYDADDFHPKKNIVKMQQGIPLNDLDRKPWLKTLSVNLARWEVETGAVLACSALKEMYRSIFNSAVDSEITWLYLYGCSELIRKRMTERREHYFKPNLLNTQLTDLEPPKYGYHFNVSSSVNDIVSSALDKLGHID